MKNDVNSFPDYPRLRQNVDFAFVEDGSVLVRGNAGSVSLNGEFVTDALPELLPQLDGHSHVDALIDGIGLDFRSELEEFLRILQGRGFLADGPEIDSDSDDRRAYWGLHAQGEEIAQAKLAAAKIVVAGYGAVGTALTQALIAGGVGRCAHVPRAAIPQSGDAEQIADCAGADEPDNWASAAADATLVVLLSDGMSLRGVDQVNEWSQRTKVPWLLARIDRATALIGPYVVPGETACFSCYELRARANAERPQEHQALFATWRKALDMPEGSPTPPEYGMIVGNWIALDLMRSIVTGRAPATTGRIIALDLHNFGSTTREILRLPRCPTCSRQRSWPLVRIWDIPKATAATPVEMAGE